MTSRDREDGRRAVDPVLRDQDLREVIEDLRDHDNRAEMLKVLWQEPFRDERIIPHLRALLTDATSCVIYIPYHYGEVCWLAAQALAAEYAVLGIDESVELRDVVDRVGHRSFDGCVSAPRRDPRRVMR